MISRISKEASLGKHNLIASVSMVVMKKEPILNIYAYSSNKITLFNMQTITKYNNDTVVYSTSDKFLFVGQRQVQSVSRVPEGCEIHYYLKSFQFFEYPRIYPYRSDF